MTTFEDIRQFALGRLGEFADRWPSGRQVPYRRTGVRQQQLFADAANENPEYSGVCAIGTVDTGAVSLDSMLAPVETPERITKIVVNECAGQAAYPVGTEITIVSIADPDGVAPRAYIRNRTLYGVENDFANISKVEMFYPYRPAPTATTEDGTRVVEVPEPHSELLVVDLAIDYARKALSLDAKMRESIVALFKVEEMDLYTRYLAHVREYAPISSRFVRPVAAPMPRPRSSAPAPAGAPRGA